jgi:probable F420-dependent oxidoreductase
MSKPKLILNLSENFTIIDPRNIRQQAECAVIAEQCGFDSVMFSEHIALGPMANALGDPQNPRAFADEAQQDPKYPWPNSIVLMSAAAQATSRINILAGAIIAPLRHPLLLAKELGTLDLLCEGRLVVIPTVGWHKDEYTALGLDFHKRGKMLDEQLDILEQVWRKSPVSYHGEFYDFTDMCIEPKAWTEKGPTLWIGMIPKLHAAAVRRIVKYGSGVFGPAPTPEEREIIRAAMSEAGRDISELDFSTVFWPEFPDATSCASLDKALEQVPGFINAGINHIGIKPSQYIDDVNELPTFCKAVVKRVEELA